MKAFLLYLIFIFSNMNCLNFEEYLGKNINSFNEAVLRFENDSNKTYHIKGFKSSLFDNSIRNVLVKTDSYDKIISIEVFFSTIDYNDFYVKLTETYGLPSRILGNDKLLKRKKFSNGNTNYVDSEFSTKEVKIEDKPVLIYWSKNGLFIKLMFNYEHKTSQIQFSNNITIQTKGS